MIIWNEPIAPAAADYPPLMATRLPTLVPPTPLHPRDQDIAASPDVQAAEALPYGYDVEIVGLLTSPQHRWDGRPETPVPDQTADRRTEIAVRAGLGVVGDRYFGRPAHRDAQVTVLAAEAVQALAAELGVPVPDPMLARRTVVLRGAEVEALRDREFVLGELRLRGGRPATPCGWLDAALGPGFHRGLRGRAGVRCAALSDGILRLGPTVLRSPVPLDPARAGFPIRPARPR